MGGIAGLIQPDCGDEPDIRPMVEAMSWRGTSWRISATTGVVIADLNVSQSAPQIVGDVRFDNANDLRQELDVGKQASHMAILDEAWNRWGRDCVKHLDGAFAFAVWDSESQSFFAARDRFGIKPFFYTHQPSKLAFASSITAIQRIPGFDVEPNNLMIGEYLLTLWDAPNLIDQTFLTGVFRLPPAHCLTWKAGHPSVRRYWSLPKDHVVELESDEAYIDAFRNEFRRAVAVQVEGAKRPGCNLSGGMDSSTISAVARSVLKSPDPLPVFFTYSPECDESTWVQSVVDTGGFDLHTIATNSPMHEVDRILEVLGEPFSYDNLDFDWSLTQEAGRSGVDVLLNGYMGDSVVSTSLDYLLELVAAQNWSEMRLQAEEGAVTTGRSVDSFFWDFVSPSLEKLTGELKWAEFLRSGRAASQAFDIPFLQVWRHLWLRPITPRPLRRLYREVTRTQRPVWWEFNPLLNADFVHELELDKRAKFLKCAWTYGFADARESHHADLTMPSTQLGLENSEAISAKHGIDTRFPFLDRKLVEFCYGLPRNLHGRDGWDRWIMRKAFEDLLPHNVTWRRGKTEYSASIFAGRQGDLKLMDELIDANRDVIGKFADNERVLADWQWYKLQTESTLDTRRIGHRLWRIVMVAIWLRTLRS